MRIIQINYEDNIGRRFNGNDLCKYYNEFGDNCKMFVRLKTTDEKYIETIYNGRLLGFIQKKVSAIESILSIQNMLYPPLLYLKREIRDADIIHIHLISMEYISLWELVLLSFIKPIILSIHEFSPFTGRCPYPPSDCEKWMTGCFSCTDLSGIFPLRVDRTRFLWMYKKRIWRRIKPTIIAGSQWMLKNIEDSPMFLHCEKKLVPFGLDLNKYQPGDKEFARKKLGIPKDHFVIMFRALSSPYKGLSTIKEALKLISPNQKITILTINETGHFNEFQKKFHVLELGWIKDSLEELYQAADVFLMPSTQETFGMMAIEAMACGVPSVVTLDTPLVEVTRAPEAAFSIHKNNPIELAKAIETLMKNINLRQVMSIRSREIAIEQYDFIKYASNIREIYQTKIDAFKKKV